MRIYICLLLLMCAQLSWSANLPDICFGQSPSADDNELIASWVSSNKFSSDINVLAAVAACGRVIGEYEVALKSIDSVLGSNNLYPLGLQLRGNIYFDMGKYDDAIVDFKSSISLKTGDGDDYLSLAESLRRIGDLGSAKSVLFDRIRTFDIKYPVSDYVSRKSFDEVNIYMALSEWLYSEGSLEKATNVAEDGFRRNSMSIELFDVLIFLLVKSANSERQSYLLSKFCINPLIISSEYCSIKNSPDGE